MNRTQVFVLFLLTLLYLGGGLALAQQYVDQELPVAEGTGQQEEVVPAEAIVSKYQHMITTGIHNLSTKDSFYSQYTGNSRFDGKNSINSTFMNLSLEFVNEFKLNGRPLEAMPSYAHGVEWIYFQANSAGVLGEKSQPSDVPSVDLNLHIITYGLQGAFFSNPFKSKAYFFMGAGWGVFYGDLSASYNGSSDSQTMNGYAVYRRLGVNVRVSESFGVQFEYRDLSTSQFSLKGNPINANAGDYDYSFSGTMVNFSANYKF